MVQENSDLKGQESSRQEIYQIKVKGVLGDEWSNWFDGMTMESDNDDPSTTTITCVISDQAALFGIISRIRDLNLKLISVNQFKADKFHPSGGD